jgi:nitrogenase subunit NifH
MSEIIINERNKHDEEEVISRLSELMENEIINFI